MNTIFKPKSEEELGEAYREMKQKTNEFMTRIFNDLHQDLNDPNIYVNNKCKFIVKHDLKNGYILVSYSRVWSYFYYNIIHNYNVINMLIESWLKENTNWPQLPIYTHHQY